MAVDQQATDAAGQAADLASRQGQALRAATDIQFAPVPPPPPPPVPSQPPAWLQWVGEMLARFVEFVFRPLARALGVGWPVMQWLLVAAGVVVLAVLGWRLGAAFWRKARNRKPQPAADWAPDAAQVAALLDDADRLAAQGHYDEAAHVLLQRSCEQIRSAHPGWLHPASTAREIAALAVLPASARAAFAVIADRVEASRYALRALLAADWQAARAAYAQFALHRPEAG